MMYVGDNPRKDFYISSICPVVTVKIMNEGIYRDNDYLNNTVEAFVFFIFAIDDIQKLTEKRNRGNI